MKKSQSKLPEKLIVPPPNGLSGECLQSEYCIAHDTLILAYDVERHAGGAIDMGDPEPKWLIVTPILAPDFATWSEKIIKQHEQKKSGYEI